MLPLATIQKIENIFPIEGADMIKGAQVLGYQTVIKNSEFAVNDKIVWHLPDTLADADNPVYAFLSKQNYRIKFCKLRGFRSQGLALPLSAFGIDPATEIDTDMTEIVKLKKYEKPVPMGGQARGNFPLFLRKTDEPNGLSLVKLIEELQGQDVYITGKQDGSSISFYLHEDVFGVTSRGVDLLDGDNAWWDIARKHRLEAALRSEGVNLAVQGELVGPKFNGNKLGADGKSIILIQLVGYGKTHLPELRGAKRVV